MRILIVTNAFPATSQTFIDLHCESLLARGHEVRVMAMSGNCEASTNLRNLLVPVEIANRKGWAGPLDMLPQLPIDHRSLNLLGSIVYDFASGRTAGASRFATACAKLFQRVTDFDIVHVHFGTIALPIAQLCSSGFIKSKVIVTFHGSDLNVRRKVPNRILYERVFRTASVFTVGTRYMADQLLQCGIAPDRVRIIPMGIDLDDFPDTSSIAAPRSGTSLVSVGRLVEVKGTEYALYAVAKLKDRWPGIRLDIVGGGARRKHLEWLTADLKLTNHVTFHGQLSHDQTLRIMGNADIFVHPAVVAPDGAAEGQGVVLGEAGAFGLPIVATRVGGIPDVVLENESALLVEQRDVSGLVESIERLLGNETLRRQMGEAGRRFVETHLDQKLLVEEWITTYASVGEV